MKRIVYIGMDVHSTNFTFCSLEPKLGGEDKVFGCMQSEADVKNVLKYIEGLKKELGDDVEFLCGYEAGCLGFSLYHQLKKQGVECVILAPSTMMASKGKRIVGNNVIKNIYIYGCNFSACRLDSIIFFGV